MKFFGKRVLSGILASLALLSLSACDKGEGDGNNKTKNELFTLEDFPLYEEKVSEYIEAASVGWSTFCERWGLDDDSISTNCIGDYYHNKQTRISYALEDLDDNKTPELIIANPEAEMIYEVYSIKNDSLDRLFYGYGYNALLCVLPDGKFLSIGPSSANYSSIELYAMKDGETSVIESYFYKNEDGTPVAEYFDGENITTGKPDDFEKEEERLYSLEEQSIFNDLEWVEFMKDSETPKTEPKADNPETVSVEDFSALFDGCWVDIENAEVDSFSGLYHGYTFLTFNDGTYFPAWYPGEYGRSCNIISVTKTGNTYSLNVFYPETTEFGGENIIPAEYDTIEISLENDELIYSGFDGKYIRIGDSFDEILADEKIREYKTLN